MKLLYLFICTLFLSNNIYRNTDIQLSIDSSKVANVYYQIIENKIPIEEELEYKLIGEHIEYQGTILNSILFIENVPFGQYKLIIKENSFSITINKQYLKTHHILKQLELFHSTPNTSDSSDIPFYISLLGITLFFLLLFLFKSHS